MSDCRCHGCEERFVGCHATCQAYAEFSARCEKARQERAREARKDSWARRVHA